MICIQLHVTTFRSSIGGDISNLYLTVPQWQLPVYATILIGPVNLWFRVTVTSWFATGFATIDRMTTWPTYSCSYSWNCTVRLWKPKSTELVFSNHSNCWGSCFSWIVCCFVECIQQNIQIFNKSLFDHWNEVFAERRWRLTSVCEQVGSSESVHAAKSSVSPDRRYDDEIDNIEMLHLVKHIFSWISCLILRDEFSPNYQY